MGDAVLRSYRARPARLPEARRAFLHESTRRWGTPGAPCPILGLATGGECWGLAFEIPDEDRKAVFRTLEKREAAAERRLETRTADTPDGAVDTWVWLSRSPTANAVDDMEALEARLRAAHGVVGTGAEYVRTVVQALEPHGLQDPLVDTLWRRLRG